MNDPSMQIAIETIAFFVLLPALLSIPIAAFVLKRDERKRDEEEDFRGETGI